MTAATKLVCHPYFKMKKNIDRLIETTYRDNILSVCQAAPQSWSEYTTFDKVQHLRAGQNIE